MKPKFTLGRLWYLGVALALKYIIQIDVIFLKFTSQPDHLQARYIQKHATTVGRYWRHIVVR